MSSINFEIQNCELNMSDYTKFYTRNLYPLQDGVLGCVSSSNTPFFLTGDTALSRYYLQHRYSDDLDFFVINDAHYSYHVEKILQNFIASEQTWKRL